MFRDSMEVFQYEALPKIGCEVPFPPCLGVLIGGYSNNMPPRKELHRGSKAVFRFSGETCRFRELVSGCN